MSVIRRDRCMAVRRMLLIVASLLIAAPRLHAQ